MESFCCHRQIYKFTNITSLRLLEVTVATGCEVNCVWRMTVPNSKMMSLRQTEGNPFLHFKSIPLFFDVGEAKVTLFGHQTGFLSATPHTFLGFSAPSTIEKIVYVIGGTEAIDTHYPTWWKHSQNLNMQPHWVLTCHAYHCSSCQWRGNRLYHAHFSNNH